MTQSHPFTGLGFRTGVVRDQATGWLLAFDPKLEADEEYFTFVSKWNAGTFGPARKNFFAITCCVVTVPHQALILLAWDGHYGFVSPQVQATGNIWEVGRPEPTATRHGDFRWVADVAGQAYAVGHMGTVYRLDAPKQWTRMDEELPRDFDIEAIHGFGPKDLYAVGKRGAVWHFNGERWSAREFPTNIGLTRVECAGDGNVYVAGHAGTLIRGRDQAWSVVDHQETDDDIWAVKWFDGALYVATLSKLYRLRGDVLEPVDFGGETPKSFYHLSAAPGVMWSIGESEVLSFDGKRWTRLV